MDLTLSHDKRKVFRNFTKDSAEFLGLSLLAALVIAVVLEVARKKKEVDQQQKMNVTHKPSAC